jgi:hypothetical protein
MTAQEQSIITNALRFQNDYRNIEALANMARGAIEQRDSLRSRLAKLESEKDK